MLSVGCDFAHEILEKKCGPQRSVGRMDRRCGRNAQEDYGPKKFGEPRSERDADPGCDLRGPEREASFEAVAAAENKFRRVSQQVAARFLVAFSRLLTATSLRPGSLDMPL